MIGDLIINLRDFFRQTFCLHDYKYVETFDSGFFRCKKCGRIKI
jgi:hypothetical protein